MATGIGKFYGLFFKSLLNKEVDFDTDTIKVVLCTSAYSPNQDTHQYFSHVTNEITGTGYTPGGLTLAGAVVSYDAATNKIKLDADDASWPDATLTARHAVIFDNTPSTAATKPLIAFVTFTGADGVTPADISATAAPFQLLWDSAGIANITVA